MADPPDDRVGVAGLRRDGLGQHFECRGRAGAGHGEGIVVVALDGLGQDTQADQHDHPGRDDHEPVAETPLGDDGHESPLRVRRIVAYFIDGALSVGARGGLGELQ